MNSDLDQSTFAAERRSPLGDPARFLEVTGSTNRDALDWAAEGAPEGALVVADHQTAGRGRWGREWLSEPGASLLFSVVLRPPGGPPPLLSTAAGIAVCRALETEARVACSLKWPNDVVVEGRKIAGILVETHSAPGDAVVVGIGINHRWDRSRLPADIQARATSLAEVTDAPPDRTMLLAAVLEQLDRARAELTTQIGGYVLIEEAAARSSVIGRVVTARLAGGATVEGRVSGLTTTGALRVETASGVVELAAAEIERLR